MMLEVRDLVIRFHDRIGGEAVHGVSFEMESGERLGIVGESGPRSPSPASWTGKEHPLPGASVFRGRKCWPPAKVK